MADQNLVGKYIKFGEYNSQPIIWRVINQDGNGSLLFAEKIISIKAFDASGDDTDGRGDSNRTSYGSNFWEKSNIREWLNSADSSVTYSHNAPTSSNVIDNPYDQEAGFLSNFTADERSAIQPVTHKVILSDTDATVKDGGTQSHNYDSDISTVLQNYDQANYMNVTDQVFFLSVKELHDYVYQRGYDHTAQPTTEAVNNSSYTHADLNDSSPWHYWLRDARASHSYTVRIVYDSGGVYNYSAHYGNRGVRPALNLKSDISLSGSGTLEDPYVLQSFTTKYLIEDDGQIKTLSDSTWTTLGPTPPTEEMFKDHGMSSLSALAGLTSALPWSSFTILRWTDDESNTGKILNYTAVPKGKTILPVSDIDISMVESFNAFTLTATESGSGKVRLLVSVDGGLNWNAWDGEAWQQVNIVDIATSGMSPTTINGITGASWDSLRGIHNTIRFSYYLEQQISADVAYTDELKMDFTTLGAWSRASAGVDYDYEYPSNNILRIKFFKNGNYKVNY